MMHLELTEDQYRVLSETLDSSLQTLRDEIAHTDTRAYRDYLVERRELLNEIRSKLH